MADRKNAKSQMTTVRIPHEVMEDMESLKLDGESNAGFIVTAMRGEIARRQIGGTTEDTIVSALQSIVKIREKALLARTEIDNIIKLTNQKISD